MSRRDIDISRRTGPLPEDQNSALHRILDQISPDAFIVLQTNPEGRPIKGSKRMASHIQDADLIAERLREAHPAVRFEIFGIHRIGESG